MRKWTLIDDVQKRELEYHEQLYSGFAQEHFAKPAVRALRAQMVRRILQVSGASPTARVLSLGCGIGDTELLLAPHVGEVVGLDLSPAAVRQATADAARLGIRNARFIEGTYAQAGAGYGLVIAIFFLHHLPDDELIALPAQLRAMLNPGGCFYSLDPSRHRLSGMVGRLLVPKLMAKYQTEDERELEPLWMGEQFLAPAFETRVTYFDFVSSPLAGLFPSWRAGYRAARVLDDALVRVPLLKRLGSNFEVTARCR